MEFKSKDVDNFTVHLRFIMISELKKLEKASDLEFLETRSVQASIRDYDPASSPEIVGDPFGNADSAKEATENKNAQSGTTKRETK